MKLPYIEAGEIVTTHGVRGEVKVLSWLDSPEMLCEFDRCRISGREYVMDSVRVQKTCNLVKLRGVDTMEDAQKLRGKTMELYREDISDELIFAAELVDVEVYADGACIGKIKEVLDYTKLQHLPFLVRGFGYGDGIRIIHQILCHIQQKFFHCGILLCGSYSTPAFFSRPRTVSVG